MEGHPDSDFQSSGSLLLEKLVNSPSMKAVVHFLAVLTGVTAVLMADDKPSADGFTPLFDGKTLEGWEQHSGKAEYRVEDGAIVGKTVAGTGNSFLCTKKKYADFILELEFKVDPSMNSGI